MTDDQRMQLVAAAAAIDALDRARRAEISGQLNGTPSAPGRRGARGAAGRRGRAGIGSWRRRRNGAWRLAEARYGLTSAYLPGERLFTGDLDGTSFAVEVEPLDMGYRLGIAGSRHHVRVLSPRTFELSKHMIEKEPPDLSRLLLCPMPGLVVAIHVKEGETVQPGQPLAVVEAMKMENILRAEKEAVVSAVKAEAGDSLAVDDVILEFE